MKRPEVRAIQIPLWTRHALLLFAAFLIYAFGYLPFAGCLAVLEGMVYGWWGISAQDFVYQLGAYAAFLAPLLLISSVITVPSVYVSEFCLRGATRSKQAILGAFLGPVALFAGAFVVSSVGAVFQGGAWSSPTELFHFPIAFIGGTVLYALTIRSIVRRGNRALSPAGLLT
jgi:hypothetical protein